MRVSAIAAGAVVLQQVTAWPFVFGRQQNAPAQRDIAQDLAALFSSFELTASSSFPSSISDPPRSESHLPTIVDGPSTIVTTMTTTDITTVYQPTTIGITLVTTDIVTYYATVLVTSSSSQSTDSIAYHSHSMSNSSFRLTGPTSDSMSSTTFALPASSTFNSTSFSFVALTSGSVIDISSTASVGPTGTGLFSNTTILPLSTSVEDRTGRYSTTSTRPHTTSDSSALVVGPSRSRSTSQNFTTAVITYTVTPYPANSTAAVSWGTGTAVSRPVPFNTTLSPLYPNSSMTSTTLIRGTGSSTLHLNATSTQHATPNGTAVSTTKGGTKTRTKTKHHTKTASIKHPAHNTTAVRGTGTGASKPHRPSHTPYSISNQTRTELRTGTGAGATKQHRPSHTPLGLHNHTRTAFHRTGTGASKQHRPSYTPHPIHNHTRTALRTGSGGTGKVHFTKHHKTTLLSYTVQNTTKLTTPTAWSSHTWSSALFNHTSSGYHPYPTGNSSETPHFTFSSIIASSSPFPPISNASSDPSIGTALPSPMSSSMALKSTYAANRTRTSTRTSTVRTTETTTMTRPGGSTSEASRIGSFITSTTGKYHRTRSSTLTSAQNATLAPPPSSSSQTLNITTYMPIPTSFTTSTPLSSSNTTSLTTTPSTSNLPISLPSPPSYSYPYTYTYTHSYSNPATPSASIIGYTTSDHTIWSEPTHVSISYGGPPGPSGVPP